MARVLAVDWDRKEIRLVLGSTKRGELHIEQVEAVYLHPEENLGEALLEAVQMMRGKKTSTLLAVDRSQVELLQMQLPTVSEAELPMLVFNQAMKDSSTIAEDSTLDFITTGKNDEGSLNITAAAISSVGHEEVLKIVESADIKPSEIQLRPYAAAKLFALTSGIDTPCLLINLLSDSFDLTVVENRHVKVSRTIQLPEETGPHELYQKVLAEIHRTLMILTKEHITADTIQHAYVFGGEEHTDLFDRIQSELNIECGPYEVFESVGASKITISTDSGRYASLVGMLLSQSKGESSDFDFANPRKAPAPPDRRRQSFTIAFGVVGLLIAGWMYLDGELAGLREQEASLKAERSTARTTSKASLKPAARLKALKDWEAKNINWLDELRDVAIQLPTSRDAVIHRMSLSLNSSSRGKGGKITFNGFVRDSSVIDVLEKNLSDEHHKIRIPRVKERSGDSYGWQYDATLEIEKRKPSEYTNHLKSIQKKDVPTNEIQGNPEITQTE